MFGKLLAGFFALPKAGKFVLGHPSVLPFIFMPLLISVGFLCGSWAIWNHFGATVLGYLGGGGEGWWSWSLNVFSWVVFAVLAWYSFSMVGMVLASPFNDFLAVKVLKVRGFTVQDVPFWTSVKLAILDSLKVLLFKVFLSIVGWIFPPLFFPFMVLMVAMDHFEYPWSHQTLGLWGRMKCLQRDGLEATGFGLFFSMIFIIPIVGLFTMPFAVIGAALLVNEHKLNIAK